MRESVLLLHQTNNDVICLYKINKKHIKSANFIPDLNIYIRNMQIVYDIYYEGNLFIILINLHVPYFVRYLFCLKPDIQIN